MWLLKIFCVSLIFAVFNSEISTVSANSEEGGGQDLELLEENLRKFVSEELAKVIGAIKSQKEECNCCKKEGDDDNLRKILQEELAKHHENHGKEDVRAIITEEFGKQNEKIDELKKDVKEQKTLIEKGGGGGGCITGLDNKIAGGSGDIKEVDPSKMDAYMTCVGKQCGPIQDLPISCTEAMPTPNHKNGVYLINGPYYGLKPFYAYCKRIDGKPYMIMQRREDGSLAFYWTWFYYKHGWGNVYSELWLGLDRVHKMTSKHAHELHIALESRDGKQGYAHYTHVEIGSEANKYNLTVDGYSGTAGDGFNSSTGHNGMKFSSWDNCNDNHAVGHACCAVQYTGAWWFNSCYESHLNGVWKPSKQEGIDWNPFGKRLKFSQMAIYMKDRRTTAEPIAFGPEGPPSGPAYAPVPDQEGDFSENVTPKDPLANEVS